jgi:hypothetical protein
MARSIHRGLHYSKRKQYNSLNTGFPGAEPVQSVFFLKENITRHRYKDQLVNAA